MNDILGRILKGYRERKCMHIKELSDKTDIAADYIQFMEVGEAAVSMDELGRICKALDIDPCQVAEEVAYEISNMEDEDE